MICILEPSPKKGRVTPPFSNNLKNRNSRHPKYPTFNIQLSTFNSLPASFSLITICSFQNYQISIFAISKQLMPEIILLLISSIVLMPPLISGFFARSQGRSFWFWFFLGCFLPFISVLILFFLPPPVDGVAGQIQTNDSNEAN